MEITRSIKSVRKTGALDVWHCPGCGVVHMSMGDTVVNFSRDEFAKFVESVVDIQYSDWADVSCEHSLKDLAVTDRDATSAGDIFH